MGKSSFAASIDTFIKKTKLKANVVLRKIAFDALRSIVMKSPVDTGRFRGSWRVGINRTDLSVEAAPVLEVTTDKKGNQKTKKPSKSAISQKAITLGKAKMANATWGDSIMITNNLPYGYKLEYGSSKQAPAGMVRLTFSLVKQNIQNNVKKLGGE
jgi:hypothetical protein